MFPYGFKPLEYIIPKKRNAYIDTGYIPNQDTHIVCEFMKETSNFWNILGGSAVTFNSYAFEFYIQNDNTTGSQCSYDGQCDTMKENYIPVGKRVTYDMNKNIWLLNGYKKEWEYKEFTCQRNLYIFASSRFGGGGHGTQEWRKRLYYMRIYDYDKLIRDFRPVKRKKDGKIGLFDLCDRKFYTSPNGSLFDGK